MTTSIMKEDTTHKKKASGRICELDIDLGGGGEMELKCYSNKIGNPSTSEDLFNY